LPGDLVVFPRCISRTTGAQVYGLEGGLGEDEVQQRRVVCLDEEEEDLLNWDVKQRRAGDDVAGIAPYAVADQVRVPWEGCEYGDLGLSV
jgi:hypothetical protein